MTRIRTSAVGGLVSLLVAIAPGDAVAAAAESIAVRARAGATLATLFSDEDYPPDALRNHQQGAVTFRLAIGPDGRPAGCTITVSSGSETLDSTTCRLVTERARFEPARDSKGRAVSDAFNGRIVWRLPEEGTMSRSEAGLSLWGVCLLGEAAKLALGELPKDEIVRRSYLGCAALEAVAKGESRDGLERERAMIAQGFEELVFKPVAILKTPRLIPLPTRR